MKQSNQQTHVSVEPLPTATVSNGATVESSIQGKVTDKESLLKEMGVNPGSERDMEAVGVDQGAKESKCNSGDNPINHSNGHLPHSSHMDIDTKIQVAEEGNKLKLIKRMWKSKKREMLLGRRIITRKGPGPKVGKELFENRGSLAPVT